MFCINIAKVDRDVAHVAMAMHVSFKCMFQMFHLFQTYVISVFHLDVATLDYDFAYIGKCFRCFHAYIASVSS